MTHDRLDLIHGTLDLLVLQTLRPGAMHGYAISSRIHERTEGEILVVDAALYKALHRLERDGLVEPEWGRSENNRRAKYYSLTDDGRERLRDELAGWRRYAAAVERVVGNG